MAYLIYRTCTCLGHWVSPGTLSHSKAVRRRRAADHHAGRAGAEPAGGGAVQIHFGEHLERPCASIFGRLSPISRQCLRANHAFWPGSERQRELRSLRGCGSSLSHRFGLCNGVLDGQGLGHSAAPAPSAQADSTWPVEAYMRHAGVEPMHQLYELLATQDLRVGR